MKFNPRLRIYGRVWCTSQSKVSRCNWSFERYLVCLNYCLNVPLIGWLFIQINAVISKSFQELIMMMKKLLTTKLRSCHGSPEEFVNWIALLIKSYHMEPSWTLIIQVNIELANHQIKISDSVLKWSESVYRHDTKSDLFAPLQNQIIFKTFRCFVNTQSINYFNLKLFCLFSW